MSAEELEKLSQLRDKGIITDEEFQIRKRQLLSTVSNQTQLLAVKKKWYNTDLGKIFLLPFCAPWGLYLVWTSKEGFFGTKNYKIGATIFVGIFFLFAMINSKLEENRRKNDDILRIKQADQFFSENKMAEGLSKISEISPRFILPDDVKKKHGEKISEYFLNNALENIQIYKTKSLGAEPLTKAETSVANAIKWGGENSKTAKVQLEIMYLKPVGSGRETYSLCKDAVSKNLKDPSSAEFEYGTFTMLGADALLGKSKPDKTTANSCIYYTRSWVKSKNAFGVMMRTNFFCIVEFDKKTAIGKVTHLSFGR